MTFEIPFRYFFGTAGDSWLKALIRRKMKALVLDKYLVQYEGHGVQFCCSLL